ncbi:hypothetical protein V8E54_008418 [Elaphomyces granulatus]
MRAFERLIWSAVFLSTLISPISAAPPFRGKHIRNETQLLQSYDYVVIGGGIAEDNSTLRDAHCCSSHQCSPSHSHRETDPFHRNLWLIIEAGILDHEEDIIRIPGMAGHAVHTIYGWNLTYVANPDRIIKISQGKAVGGGSLLNRMVFDRGSVADYNRWETLGNKGWGWDGLLPFFDFSLSKKNLTNDKDFAAEARRQYYSKHTGPYSTTIGDFLVFLPMKNYTNQSASIYQQALEQDPTACVEADTPESVVAGYVAQHKLLVDGVNAEDQAVLEFV